MSNSIAPITVENLRHYPQTPVLIHIRCGHAHIKASCTNGRFMLILAPNFFQEEAAILSDTPNEMCEKKKQCSQLLSERKRFVLDFLRTTLSKKRPSHTSNKQGVIRRFKNV